ncbi:MAG TPA: NADH-quinone oxidoreductase subunit K [Aggregatilineales bacterium]|nr:NADH-quinone oxidoreductase subunit K [Aggregatilineales bacterium]
MNFPPIVVVAVGILALLGIGLYGLLVSRNLIKIIVALQVLLKAAELGLVLAGYASGQMNLGQSLAVTVIVIDTVVAMVGLALGVQVRRRFGTFDVQQLSGLRG